MADRTLKRVQAALAAQDHVELAQVFEVASLREGLYAGANYVRAANGASPEEKAEARAWLADRGLLVPPEG